MCFLVLWRPLTRCYLPLQPPGNWVLATSPPGTTLTVNGANLMAPMIGENRQLVINEPVGLATTRILLTGYAQKPPRSLHHTPHPSRPLLPTASSSVGVSSLFLTPLFLLLPRSLHPRRWLPCLIPSFLQCFVSGQPALLMGDKFIQVSSSVCPPSPWYRR